LGAICEPPEEAARIHGRRFRVFLSGPERTPPIAEIVMAESVLSTKRLLALRKLTRAFADLLRGQMKEHLALLAPRFAPKSVFGEFMEGPKEYVKGAEANFKELKAAYDSICTTKPFNLPKEFKTPLEMQSIAPELQVFEYVHEAKDASQAKSVTVSAPLKFVLTYSGFGPKRLKELLGAQGSASDAQEFLLHTLIMSIVLARQPGIAKLFEALRFPLSISKIGGLGDLPFAFVTAAVPTVLPPDDVVIENTEISGSNAFEEIVNLDELAKLGDPFKEKLIELAKSHGETIG